MSSELQWGYESDGESVSRDGRGQPRARPQRGRGNSFGGSDDDDDDDELLSLDSGSDDDEEDDTSSEDLEEDVRAVALGPCEMDQATKRLTKDRQGAYRIRDLSVHAGLQPEMVDSEDDEEEEEPQVHPLVFQQFVNAIASHRRIQNLRLMNGNFRLEGAFPSPAYVGHTPEQGDEDDAVSHLSGEADLERLFRSALPNHPSLTKITLFENWIHPRYIRVFMKSLAGSPRTLSSLKFDVIPLTRMGYRAIGKAFQQNARIEKLVVAGCWADVQSKMWSSFDEVLKSSSADSLDVPVTGAPEHPPTRTCARDALFFFSIYSVPNRSFALVNCIMFTQILVGSRLLTRLRYLYSSQISY
jgi:hypothetical protein